MALDNIAPHWEKSPLPEVAFFQEGPGLLKSQFADDGIAFLNIRTFQNGRIDKSKCQFIRRSEFDDRYEHFLLNAGDIVVSSSGTTDKVAVVSSEDLPLMLNTSTIRFRSKDDKRLSQGFLRLFLHSEFFQAQVFAVKTDAAISNYGPTHLKRMVIAFPSLAEQLRLVARIEALTSRLEQARQARQAALAEAEMLIHSVRHEEFAKLLATQPTRPLGRCGRVLGGGTPSKANSEFWRGKIPWVTAKEMWNYEVVDSQLKISEAAMKASPVKLIPANSVLFVVRGSILFKRVPVAVNRLVCTINQDMKAIVPDDGILGDYLAHMMWAANEELKSLVDTAGNSAGKLATEKWSAVEIPIPKTKDEQRRIVSHLDALAAKQTELRRLQTEAEAELAAFTPALLAKAFRGEL